MASVLYLTEKSFYRVIASNKPVLVDFWAPWCAPCRMLTPVIEQLAEEFSGKAYVAKVNVDQNPRLAAKYRAATIPMVCIFQNGRLVHRSIGVKPGAVFAAMLKKRI